MKPIIIMFACLLLPLLSGCHAETNTTVTGPVSLIQGRYVIDVRTESEWKNGHIEGATLIPYDEIKAKIPNVTTDKNAPLALYCRSGRRSEIARKSLHEMGYTNVENWGSLQDAQKRLASKP
jgi:phage shock protein E